MLCHLRGNFLPVLYIHRLSEASVFFSPEVFHHLYYSVHALNQETHESCWPPFTPQNMFTVSNQNHPHYLPHPHLLTKIPCFPCCLCLWRAQVSKQNEPPDLFQKLTDTRRAISHPNLAVNLPAHLLFLLSLSCASIFHCVSWWSWLYILT